MHTLYAFDLTARKECDLLWRESHGASVVHTGDPAFTKVHPDLPRDGFASPFGFWFAPAPSWETKSPGYRVEFGTPNETSRAKPERGEPRTRRSSTAAVVGLPKSISEDRQPLGVSNFPLDVEIDPYSATIGVHADTWAVVGVTVLFAIAQYWRFAAINRTLDDLADWSRQDLASHTSCLSIIRPARSRMVRSKRRTLQRIILDLPVVEGPLTNPAGHFSSRRGKRLYGRLRRCLELDQLRGEVDEQIEVVESIFDSLAESLNHCQSLAFQVALELIIVAVLLLDVGLYFLDAFSR